MFPPHEIITAAPFVLGKIVQSIQILTLGSYYIGPRFVKSKLRGLAHGRTGIIRHGMEQLGGTGSEFEPDAL